MSGGRGRPDFYKRKSFYKNLIPGIQKYRRRSPGSTAVPAPFILRFAFHAAVGALLGTGRLGSGAEAGPARRVSRLALPAALGALPGAQGVSEVGPAVTTDPPPEPLPDLVAPSAPRTAVRAQIVLAIPVGLAAPLTCPSRVRNEPLYAAVAQNQDPVPVSDVAVLYYIVPADALVRLVRKDLPGARYSKIIQMPPLVPPAVLPTLSDDFLIGQVVLFKPFDKYQRELDRFFETHLWEGAYALKRILPERKHPSLRLLIS